MGVRDNVKNDLIRAVPLFSSCSNEEIAALAAACDELAVREGTQLTRQGARGREFMVIVEGAAEVVRDGKSIARLGAGDFLGEIALLADMPRTATVTTVEPTTLLVLTDRAFEQVALHVPIVRDRLLTALAERLGPSAT